MSQGAGSTREPDGGFEALFRREIAPITRTAYLIVGDAEVAREIAQEAFVQVLRHWDKVRGLESPGGWARRIAIRKAVRHRRRDSRGRILLASTARTLVSESDIVSVDVHRALLALPPRQRAALALRYFDDRPVAEIAALLGCSEGSVKTHLSRGRAALAKQLGEEADDVEPR